MANGNFGLGGALVDGYNAVSGTDPVTGQALTTGQRVLSGIASVFNLGGVIAPALSFDGAAATVDGESVPQLVDAIPENVSDPSPVTGNTVGVVGDNQTETYFRVEGGGSGTKTSQNRISVNPDGTVTIDSGCSGQLCVSTNGPNHAAYYLENKRSDGSVVVFEVDADLNNEIIASAVEQKPIPGVARNPDAPKIVDPSKGQPSISLELPKIWDRLIEQHSSNARVLTSEEFFDEFGH